MKALVWSEVLSTLTRHGKTLRYFENAEKNGDLRGRSMKKSTRNYTPGTVVTRVSGKHFCLKFDRVLGKKCIILINRVFETSKPS